MTASKPAPLSTTNIVYTTRETTQSGDTSTVYTTNSRETTLPIDGTESVGTITHFGTSTVYSKSSSLTSSATSSTSMKQTQESTVDLTTPVMSSTEMRYSSIPDESSSPMFKTSVHDATSETGKSSTPAIDQTTVTTNVKLYTSPNTHTESDSSGSVSESRRSERVYETLSPTPFPQKISSNVGVSPSTTFSSTLSTTMSSTSAPSSVSSTMSSTLSPTTASSFKTTILQTSQPSTELSSNTIRSSTSDLLTSYIKSTLVPVSKTSIKDEVSSKIVTSSGSVPSGDRVSTPLEGIANGILLLITTVFKCNLVFLVKTIIAVI